MKDVLSVLLWTLCLLKVTLQVSTMTKTWNAFAVHPFEKRGDLHINTESQSNGEGSKTNRPNLMIDLNTLPTSESSDDGRSSKNYPGTTSSTNQSDGRSFSSQNTVREHRKGEQPAWRVRYNLKRKQKREEALANNPKEAKRSASEAYIRRKQRMEAKRLIWEQSPTLQAARYNPFTPVRSQIRKYVREGQGTEEEKAFVKKLSVRDSDYKKAKQVAKKGKSS